MGTKKKETVKQSLVFFFQRDPAPPSSFPRGGPPPTQQRKQHTDPPSGPPPPPLSRANMTSPSKRRELDITKLLLSDHDVELVDDNISEFYITFHGPKESE